MKDSLGLNFGLLIAFLLPGFLLLWGASLSLPEVGVWLANGISGQTVGSFLFASLASLALGLVISALRTVTIDELLYRCTRLDGPKINYAKLKNSDVRGAFEAAIENNYRYYQYYARSLVALVVAFLLYVLFAEEKPASCAVMVAIWATVIAVSFALASAARKELQSFNERAADITK